MKTFLQYLEARDPSLFTEIFKQVRVKSRVPDKAEIVRRLFPQMIL
jgi:hypothetical protein